MFVRFVWEFAVAARRGFSLRLLTTDELIKISLK